tara:strand:- start:48 stop:386 length:339 start_codon:yes stop_codon:yes gene_type:complete
MNKINIKPLSVNKAWRGRRFKTKDYTQFEKDLLLLLPKDVKVPEGELSLWITYGFSSKGSDIDNPTKMVIDILSKKYGFNDNRIYHLDLTKEIVKKGNEFIKFDFHEYPLQW